MEQIQKVVMSLEMNKTIDNETKNKITKLMEKFNKNFPDISLENLSKRLETLSFKKGSKYAYENPMQYVGRDNQVIVNITKLKNDEVDVDFEMMKSLLSVITTKDNSFGFGGNRSLEALNVGMQEVIANNIIGNEGKSDYEDEQVLINSIGQSLGVDILLNCFFKNDSEILLKKMYTTCGNIEEMNKFLNQTNYNMHTRKQLGVSRLFELQKQTIKLFGSGYDFIMKKEVFETPNLKYPGDIELQSLLKKEIKAKVI